MKLTPKAALEDPLRFNRMVIAYLQGVRRAYQSAGRSCDAVTVAKTVHLLQSLGDPNQRN